MFLDILFRSVCCAVANILELFSLAKSGWTREHHPEQNLNALLCIIALISVFVVQFSSHHPAQTSLNLSILILLIVLVRSKTDLMLTTALNIFSWAQGKLLIIIQYCVTNRPQEVSTRQASQISDRFIRTSQSLPSCLDCLEPPYGRSLFKMKVQKLFVGFWFVKSFPKKRNIKTIRKNWELKGGP